MVSFQDQDSSFHISIWCPYLNYIAVPFANNHTQYDIRWTWGTITETMTNSNLLQTYSMHNIVACNFPEAK